MKNIKFKITVSAMETLIPEMQIVIFASFVIDKMRISICLSYTADLLYV